MIEPAALVRVPAGLSLLVAGALNVVGRTAVASVESQRISAGDVVLVSGAAGGVGILTAQLCVLRGARVFGTASARNHAMLRRLGIHPLAYGGDLVDEVRAAGGCRTRELTLIAGLLADGAIELPIDSVHPLENVREAYDRSIAGHATGKIVIVTDLSTPSPGLGGDHSFRR
ncbi:zinc-binding dehydrogenase [Microbacterium sp. SA39]|uniref:zinc-binding dehydrogenase n=1 Tax=Microbacterium sp. SA39 TaxID=1263625 RepID=UPI0005FA6A52|nr:zinc-binding dehydrogenase [Microbacterium sp. SA39]